MTNSNFQLKIQKHSQPYWLLMVVILMPMICGFLTEVLPLPASIKYVIDVCLIALIVLIGINLSKQKILFFKGSMLLFIGVIVFLILTFIVYITKYQSILYYAWGVRNNFRFYVAFFSFVLFFKTEDIDTFLKFFDIFFWLNSALCIIQFFVFDLRGDFLGGFFGIIRGCNGSLNIFMVMIVIKAILYYLNKKENLLYCVSKCSTALIIATLSELKFFFVEFIAILFIALLITEVSARKIYIFIFGIIGVMLGASILISLFPHFANFLSIEYILELTSTGGYAGSDQLNRLTTIPIISKEILTTSPLKWFGLGLGNCDTANFEFLKTPFYYDYIYLRYNWFSTSFLYLETGFLGLIFFFGFFIINAVKSFFIAKESAEDKVYCQMSLIASVICIMLGIYNASLRTEAGYLIYFMLAFSLIVKKKLVLNNE